VWTLLSFVYQNAFDIAGTRLSLNAYFDRSLEIIATFDDFTVQHISRDENIVVNDLASKHQVFGGIDKCCMF
jgi:hypothetical protein